MGTLCGKAVGYRRKVPDLGHMSGLRPLFNLFGLFSHLNQIKQLITRSQSAWSTVVSPRVCGCGMFLPSSSLP